MNDVEFAILKSKVDSLEETVSELRLMLSDLTIKFCEKSKETKERFDTTSEVIENIKNGFIND